MTTIPHAVTSEIEAAELARIQRRTLRTLVFSQVCGGVGLVSGYSVTALLARDLTGSTTLAGLSAACTTIGATLASFPLARLAAGAGRRPGMRTGYSIAAFGAFLATMAAVTRFFPLLPIGVLGIGAGTATNLAARYAASDLAPPERRARAIGVIVWATTLGSGLGSLLSLSVLDPLGQSIGLPDFGGSYLASALLFLCGAAIIELRLRPDPLVLAGGVGRANTPRLPLISSLQLILAVPRARLAVVAMMVSQGTMICTMTMTPLYMDDGGQGGGAISIMLFSHILGMYLLSPLVGSLVDRAGRLPMIVVGGALLAVGAVLVGLSPAEELLGITAGMTVIGLGWCFALIAASGLLTDSFPIVQRASIQGAGDVCMSGFGAIAGITAGAIVALRSFRELNLGAAALGVGLVLAVVFSRRRVAISAVSLT